jgi:hypothetical protein
LQRSVIHFFFILIFFIFALRDLLVIQRWYLPWQADLGFLVLLCGVYNGTSRCSARFVASPKVGITALVIRVLDVFSYILP